MRPPAVQPGCRYCELADPNLLFATPLLGASLWKDVLLVGTPDRSGLGSPVWETKESCNCMYGVGTGIITVYPRSLSNTAHVEIRDATSSLHYTSSLLHLTVAHRRLIAASLSLGLFYRRPLVLSRCAAASCCHCEPMLEVCSCDNLPLFFARSIAAFLTSRCCGHVFIM